MQVKKVYSLLGNGVLPDDVLQSWHETFGEFAKTRPGWEQRFPSNGAGNYPTMDQFESAADAGIIHLTCHGGMKDDQNEYFWTLDDRQPRFLDYRIYANVARQSSFAKRPLVFGNACASAAEPDSLTALQGFGSSFLIGGALNFVGTFAPITKTLAVEFAKRFYKQLLGSPEPQAVGEALRATKESFALQNWQDPSYLFYCLYGPCDSTYMCG